MSTNITGGVKFFDKSKTLATLASASASSGLGAAFVLSSNIATQWQSIGSTDGTTELLTITLDNAISINRFFLLRHNFKDYEIFFIDSSGNRIALSNVCDLDGAGDMGDSSDDVDESAEFYEMHRRDGFASSSFADADEDFNSMNYIDDFAFSNFSSMSWASENSIPITNNVDTSSYFEFDAITVKGILIAINSTTTANEQKYLGQAIATNELGTFEGYPQIANLKHSKGILSTRTLSNRYVVTKRGNGIKVGINFKNHPFQNDIDLVEDLFNSVETFLIWPCGGRRGTTYFRNEILGWKLEDIFQVQINSDFNPSYSQDIYINGISLNVNLVEAV